MGKRIDILLQRFCNNNISVEEKEELLQLLTRVENEELIKQSIENMWEEWEGIPLLSHEQSDALYENILTEILKYKKQIIHHRQKRIHYKKLMIAASLLFIVASGVFLIVNRRSNTYLQTENQDVKAPTTSSATITLSNGKQIPLKNIKNQNSFHNDELSHITVDENTIQYEEDKTVQRNDINTLTNPVGSKTVAVVLSDGTKVWLNAGSSLRYPVSFNDNERLVYITGEAYFEVEHKMNTATKNLIPFIVQLANGGKIKVVGTQFNVNAYNVNEIKTTLVKGKIIVSPSPINSDDHPKIILPGEQAIQNFSGNISTRDKINVDAVLAWKGGYFYFEGEKIQEIMDELSRWYDVQVVYQDQIPYTFVAKISRNDNISSILKVFELTNLIKFKINGNKITVMQPEK